MESSELIQGTETILVVEDEEAVRNLVREILEMCGYKVVVARNGLEGISSYEREEGNFDLVITDMVMPQMGGQSLVDYLSFSLQKTRILYMSGYMDSEIQRQGVSQNNFIQKPFTPESLARKVREVLDAPQTGTATSTGFSFQ